MGSCSIISTVYMKLLGDSSDDSSNALNWVLDALLGKRESPSLKYNREFSQDDTNNRTKKSKHSIWGGEARVDAFRKRSNSIDTEFRSRFELLPDDSPGLPSSPLFDPLKDQTASSSAEATDTFKFKPSPNHEVQFQPPKSHDPLISHLFANTSNSRHDSTPDRIASSRALHHSNFKATPTKKVLSSQLPGKFPTPKLNAFCAPSIPNSINTRNSTINCIDDYIKLLELLSSNNKELQGLQQDLDEQNHQLLEDAYRQKYFELRQELIQELRQSKLVYDNYSKLYEKYKSLKKTANNLIHYEKLVPNLEAEILDLTISKQESERKYSDQLMHSQLQYEARIHELETLLENKNTSISNTTPTTSADIASDQSILPYQKYNDSIDTQFINHIVK